MALEAAVISALGVCDEAVIVVGQSQDTTMHFVYQMQEDYGEEKIKVVETYIHFDRSRAKHRAWYAGGGGLEDGRLPEVKPFEFRIKDRLANGQVAQWQGKHPAVMDSWFKQHEFLWNYGDKKMYI